MKRKTGSIIILLITIALVSIGLILNINTTLSLSDSLSYAEKLCSDGNLEKAERVIDNSINEWENKSKKIMLFYHHDKLDKVDESLHLIQFYAKARPADLCSVECNKTVIMLGHMQELEYPTLYNIF